MKDLDVTLSALADPTRRQVVDLLRTGACRAGELAASAEMSAGDEPALAALRAQDRRSRGRRRRARLRVYRCVASRSSGCRRGWTRSRRSGASTRVLKAHAERQSAPGWRGSSTDSVTTSVEVAVGPAFEVFTEEIDVVPARSPQLEGPRARRRDPLRSRRRQGLDRGVGRGDGRGLRLRPHQGVGTGEAAGVRLPPPRRRSRHRGRGAFEPTGGGTAGCSSTAVGRSPPAIAVRGVAIVRKGEPVLLGWFAGGIDKEAQ